MFETGSAVIPFVVVYVMLVHSYLELSQELLRTIVPSSQAIDTPKSQHSYASTDSGAVVVIPSIVVIIIFVQL